MHLSSAIMPYRAGMVGVTLVLLASSGCHPQTSKPETPASRPADAIDDACRFAAALPVDEDGVQTQSKTLEHVVQACLKRGEAARAEAVATTIKGWQRGTACADVAAAYARLGQTNQARRALLDAEAWRALFREKTRDTNMGWTTGRIHDHIALARAALGETDDRTVCLTGRMADVNARVLGEMIAGNASGTNIGFLKDVPGDILTNRDCAVQQGFGRGVLAWAEGQTNLTGREVDEIVAVVQASLELQPAPYQLPIRERLIGLLRQQGRAREAQASLTAFEEAVRSTPGRYYLSEGLADAATLYAVIDTNRSARLLDEAEIEARQCSMATRSAALAHVAERACDMGLTSTAQRVYIDCLAAACSPEGQVPRLERLVDACASLGATGVPLTPELRTMLETQARHEITSHAP